MGRASERVRRQTRVGRATFVAPGIEAVWKGSSAVTRVESKVANTDVQFRAKRDRPDATAAVMRIPRFVKSNR